MAKINFYKKKYRTLGITADKQALDALPSKFCKESFHLQKNSLSSPIKTEGIENFDKWLFINGFRSPLEEHLGFDFQAYQAENNDLLLELPSQTPIRSILPGLVIDVVSEEETPYNSVVCVLHEKYPNKDIFVSQYWHTKPEVKIGQEIKEGEPVGFPVGYEWKNKEIMRHLHFTLALCLHESRNELIDMWTGKPYLYNFLNVHYYDPQSIIKGISNLDYVYCPEWPKLRKASLPTESFWMKQKLPR